MSKWICFFFFILFFMKDAKKTLFIQITSKVDVFLTSDGNGKIHCYTDTEKWFNFFFASTIAIVCLGNANLSTTSYNLYSSLTKCSCLLFNLANKKKIINCCRYKRNNVQWKNQTFLLLFPSFTSIYFNFHWIVKSFVVELSSHFYLIFCVFHSICMYRKRIKIK